MGHEWSVGNPSRMFSHPDARPGRCLTLYFCHCRPHRFRSLQTVGRWPLGVRSLSLPGYHPPHKAPWRLNSFDLFVDNHTFGSEPTLPIERGSNDTLSPFVPVKPYSVHRIRGTAHSVGPGSDGHRLRGRLPVHRRGPRRRPRAPGSPRRRGGWQGPSAFLPFLLASASHVRGGGEFVVA